MEAINSNLLKYPDHVIAAAVITGLDIKNVLQEFIDSTSFYSFYSQKIDEFQNQIIEEVLDLIEQYYHAYSTVKAPDSRPLSAKYLQQIHELKSRIDLTAAEKEVYSTGLMEKWAQELSPLIQLPAKVGLEQNNSVAISFEFNMMCSLCRMKPEHALSQFMDQISIAEIQAQNQFNQEVSYRNRPYLIPTDLPCSQSAVRKKYEEKFKMLYNRMNRVKSFDRRLAGYQDFYNQWYQELIVEDSAVSCHLT